MVEISERNAAEKAEILRQKKELEQQRKQLEAQAEA